MFVLSKDISFFEIIIHFNTTREALLHHFLKNDAKGPLFLYPNRSELE